MEPRAQMSQPADSCAAVHMATGVRLASVWYRQTLLKGPHSGTDRACLQDPHLQNRPKLLDVEPPAERELVISQQYGARSETSQVLRVVQDGAQVFSEPVFSVSSEAVPVGLVQGPLLL